MGTGSKIPPARSEVVALGPKVEDWRLVAVDQLNMARAATEMLIAQLDGPPPDPATVNFLFEALQRHGAAGIDSIVQYASVCECAGSA